MTVAASTTMEASPGGQVAEAASVPRLAAAGSPSRVADLSTRLARGDEEAWHEFHDRYAARLHRYLLVVVRGDETRAADALQSAFVRAARHVREFRDEEAFWSWLTVLARSAAADETRKQWRFARFLSRFGAESGPTEGQASASGGGDGDGAGLAELVRETLTELPDCDRDLLVRKYLDGASVRAISGELATTEKAVESRLARARGKLRAAVLSALNPERP